VAGANSTTDDRREAGHPRTDHGAPTSPEESGRQREGYYAERVGASEGDRSVATADEVRAATGMSVQQWGDHCRLDAVASLESGDWHGAYISAKSWIASGGGARIVDPWLVYAASALMHGQPRTAIHSIDIALQHWISAPADRAILHWARGCIVRETLRDPKTAKTDLETAATNAPEWLVARLAAASVACDEEALHSRKRKRSVNDAPALAVQPADPSVALVLEPSALAACRPSGKRSSGRSRARTPHGTRPRSPKRRHPRTAQATGTSLTAMARRRSPAEGLALAGPLAEPRSSGGPRGLKTTGLAASPELEAELGCATRPSCPGCE
jgi:hypothetical protein